MSLIVHIKTALIPVKPRTDFYTLRIGRSICVWIDKPTCVMGTTRCHGINESGRSFVCLDLEVPDSHPFEYLGVIFWRDSPVFGLAQEKTRSIHQLR